MKGKNKKVSNQNTVNLSITVPKELIPLIENEMKDLKRNKSSTVSWILSLFFEAKSK